MHTRDRLWSAACRWYVVAALAWCIRYATLGTIPLWGEPVWRHWFDQNHYLVSATALAHGDLSAAAHWYPLGYAIMAAPFAWMLPDDPFFVLDLLLFLAACNGFQRVVARLGIAPWPAALCFLATTLVQTGLASSWAHPWTTTLSAALIWWLIDRTLAVGTPGTPAVQATRPSVLLAIGALAAGLPLVRPVDALIGLTCLAFAGFALLRRRALTGNAVLTAIAGGAVVCAAYAALHLAIYGPHPTPYMIAAAHTGFIWSDLGWKAYILLVDAHLWYPDSRTILQTLPWIIPGCAGLIAVAITQRGDARRVVALLFATIVPTGAMMLTYADLQTPGLWYFGNVHYFKWMMPAFGAGLLSGWRLLRVPAGRRVLAGALVLLVLPLMIRIVPTSVDARTPARMLLFKGGARPSWDEAYFSPATIVDDRGTMRNVTDFHQVPDATGERAIAISRLFGAHPRRADPGERPVVTSQPPYARLAGRLTIIGF